MKQGDLCYIPQAVQLFNEHDPYIMTTHKPVAAIYLRDQGQYTLLWISGRQMLAPRRHIYPMEKGC